MTPLCPTRKSYFVRNITGNDKDHNVLNTLTIVAFIAAAVLSGIGIIRVRRIQRRSTDPNPHANSLIAALGSMFVVCIGVLIFLTLTD